MCCTTWLSASRKSSRCPSMVDSMDMDIAYAEITHLEELIDRDSLREVCRSFFELFGLSIRVLSARGALLASVHEERSVCRYVNSLTHGRVACSELVAQVQLRTPEKDGETLVHPCFTGAIYHIVPIIYDQRQLGRIIIGPFLPTDVTSVPESLLKIDAKVDPEKVRLTLAEMPRVREQTAGRIGAHL